MAAAPGSLSHTSVCLALSMVCRQVLLSEHIIGQEGGEGQSFVYGTDDLICLQRGRWLDLLCITEKTGTERHTQVLLQCSFQPRLHSNGKPI